MYLEESAVGGLQALDGRCDREAAIHLAVGPRHGLCVQREFFIDNLLIRIHFIIVMIRWTGLAPWEFEFPFPGSLISTFLARRRSTPWPLRGDVHSFPNLRTATLQKRAVVPRRARN